MKGDLVGSTSESFTIPINYINNIYFADGGSGADLNAGRCSTCLKVFVHCLDKGHADY
jgi:hypothetical protein